LRINNGTLFATFQEAAIDLGILAGQEEGEYALTEAVAALYTPHQLRRLFSDVLINECTNTPLLLWESFHLELSKDHFIRCRSQDVANNLALIDIDKCLAEHGKLLTDYGLTMPEDVGTEVQHELECWAPHTANLRQTVINSLAMFNPEQRDIYDLVVNAAEQGQPLKMFIDGKAGRGKTFLLKALCAKLRACGKIVLPTATSAFAAQLYPGGRTTHSAFKVNKVLHMHLDIQTTYFYSKDPSGRTEPIT
jgi:hypothetical protein